MSGRTHATSDKPNPKKRSIRRHDMAAVSSKDAIDQDAGIASQLENLYSVLTQAPAMIAVGRGKNLTYEFANPLFLKVLGKTPAIIGKPLLEVMPELKGQEIMTILNSVLETGEPYRGSEVLVRVDSNNDGFLEDLYFNFIYQPLRNASGEVDGIMTHAVEVTEQVMARRRAEENESRYRTLFNTIDEGFCIIEMIYGAQGKPYDFRYLEANDIFSDQSGIDDPIGKKVSELIPNLEVEWFEVYGEVARTGKAVRFTQKSDAVGKWFDVHASRIGGDDSSQVAILFKDITEEKQAKKQLQDSEAYYREMADNTPVITWLTDSKGSCTYISKQWYDFTGQTKKQALGAGWMSMIHPDDADAVAAVFEQANINPKPIRIEYRLRGADGTYRWSLDAGQPKYDADHVFEGYTGSVIDIHDRKVAEDALKQQLELTEVITNNTSVCLFMLDTDGRLTYMNPSAIKITGYSEEEAMGKLLHDLVHYRRPDGKPFPASKCRIFSAYSSGKYRSTYEDMFYRKEGSRFQAKVTAMPIRSSEGLHGTIVELQDITEEKQAIKALEASESRLRFMAESMPQKVFTALPEGTVDYYNPQWVDYTGLDTKQIHDWHWKEIVHPDDYEAHAAAVEESLRTGRQFEQEHRLRGRDGKYHWHITRAHPMCNDKGETIRWMGSSTDIEAVKRTLTRKKQLEEIASNLREQRTQLIELNRAKDEFISLASHQLRTPATGVKQYIAMVIDGYAGEVTDDQRHMLAQAYESNEREITIINDLLKVAQVDAGRVKLNCSPVDIVQLLRHVIDDQKSKFKERDQTVVYDPGTDRAIIPIDSDRMRMVLENLIDNASKYTEHGKKIEIGVRRFEGDVAVTIRDEGVGINEEDLDKLFKKFSRLDNPLSVSVGGTGLGLYWAKKIVDLHGGTISVDSKQGKGTTFTVMLPT